jgi:hypothetical protein
LLPFFHDSERFCNVNLFEIPVDLNADWLQQLKQLYVFWSEQAAGRLGRGPPN